MCKLRIWEVVERLLNGRLYSFLWRNGHGHAQQYGFTHAKSAVLALHNLKTRLLQLRASKIPAILMSLDFQGAFDSVWHRQVLRFLRERGVPVNLYHKLRSFLTDRLVVLRTETGEVEARPTLGSPQGLPLSPLLWNVIFQELLCLPLPKGITTQAYADDTLIIIPGESKKKLEELGSEVLRKVLEWGRVRKVLVNKDKTFAYCLCTDKADLGPKFI
ncbi:hypothetical protein MRX96_057015 [Rhipicephalus microplus]